MTSVSVPLSRHRIFRSTDPATAAERSRALFCAHRLTEIDDRQRFHACQYGIGLRDLSVSVLGFRTRVRLRTAELRGCFLVLVPVSGTAKINVSGKGLAVYPEMGCVLGACGPVRMTWSADCVMLVVRMERDAVEGELREWIGGHERTPLRFEPAMDLTAGLRASWWRRLTHLIDDLDAESALSRHPLCADGAESGLMLGLLAAQPHCHSEKLRSTHVSIGEHRILRAVELLEREPRQPWSTVRLARDAGIGVRTMYAEFRRVLDTTPMAYLRGVRLRRVYRELRRARPGTGVTVAEIATRWGFNHLGEFAATYRRFYAENPSATLRRVDRP